MSDEKLDKVRKRHAEAIERFGSYYFANGTFGKPQLRIGVQSFSFDHAPEDEDPRHDAAHREWFGIMIAAALKNLVDGETAALEAKLAEAKALLAECAADLASYVDHDYPEPSRSTYPSMKRRYERDMELVYRVRTTLAKLEKENDCEVMPFLKDTKGDD